MKGKNKGKCYRTRHKGLPANSMHAGVAAVQVAEAPTTKHGPTISDYRPIGFIPKRVGSELSFMPFADEVESSLAAPVVKCILRLYPSSFPCRLTASF
jgi:hypothetical protein